MPAASALPRGAQVLLLLPLCPVYGLGMTALLALWEPGMGPLVLACLAPWCVQGWSIWSTSSMKRL